MLPFGYICPICGDLSIQDPDLPICNILENGDLEKKSRYDDWGIPI
jgi:hypothetical protein